MGKKLTTKEFIKKAKRKHREKYDYSKVEYINCQTKVCIICPEHGEFWQMPSAHIYGQGCPKCANKRKGSNFRMGKKEFIRRATLLHKGKYNYDKVEMERLSDKIIITCPIHGDFTQKASDHLIYKGCKKCSKRYMDTTYFIERAKEVHGNKYDYSLVEISKGITKVKIKCPTHGVFEQSYADHLRGCGCWECYKQRLPEVNKKSNETFLNQLKEIYGDKYDLSKVDYRGKDMDISLICPIHGEFIIKANAALSGRGCPSCYCSKGESIIANYLCRMGITYRAQYVILTKGLPYPRNKMIADFYVIYKRKKYIIEFNGIQHYEQTRHFHSCKDDFLRQKERDKRMAEWCLNNNVKLIIIRYDEIHNIDNILSRQLKD